MTMIGRVLKPGNRVERAQRGPRIHVGADGVGARVAGPVALFADDLLADAVERAVEDQAADPRSVRRQRPDELGSDGPAQR